MKYQLETLEALLYSTTGSEQRFNVGLCSKDLKTLMIKMC